MRQAIEELRTLGFSQYEAQAYITLLQHQPLNGYELAKASGIPRPNIYGVLRKLEGRGAVLGVDTPAGTRYTPVPAEELIEKLHNQFESSLQSASQLLSQINAVEEPEPVWNINGISTLLEHAQTLVESARQQVLIAVWPQEAEALEPVLAQAEKIGVQVTSLCLANCVEPCSTRHGRSYHYPLASAQHGRWFVLVADQSEVLAGEIGPSAGAAAFRTRQNLLVELAGWYIRHSIALAAVLKDAGAFLDEALSPETRRVLAALGPYDSEAGWLKHMHHLVEERGMK